MGNREKILIIDDSSVQADMLRSILEGDYDVTVAHTAESGLHYARVGDFALILEYVNMPLMDGFGLMRNTHVKLYRYRTQLERQSMVDPMTGIPNRRSYDLNCHNKWQEAIRFRQPISLCMFDIDRFKAYNDTFGHPAGDGVICSVAQTVTEYLRRSTDYFARYGGEEFVSIIIGSDARTACRQMKKICQAVENLHIPHTPEAGQWVTISIGGVTLVPEREDSYDTYLKVADTMLYDAKRFGRNRVVWSTARMEELGEFE